SPLRAAISKTQVASREGAAQRTARPTSRPPARLRVSWIPRRPAHPDHDCKPSDWAENGRVRIPIAWPGRKGGFRAGAAAQQFRVVLVYQDFEMALAGKELCDALEKEVGAGEAVLSVWPFHLLHEPELHLAAVNAAEQADVVIVAHRDTHSL